MPPANKLIQAKIEARNRKILSKRVKSVKGIVDVSVPESFRHGRVNAKKLKVRIEGQLQVPSCAGGCVKQQQLTTMGYRVAFILFL